MAAQLFLRDTASDLGGAGQKALSLDRGAASANATTTATNSGTNIQVTTTAGGQALTWFSGPIIAQTLTGTVDVNIRGRESVATVNAGAGILIERTNSAGVVQSTILSDRTIPAAITEYTTTDAAKTSTGLAITSTIFSAGDRIKVTLKVRNVGTMATGTTINSYDGPTTNAAGDTYITFSGLLVVQNGIAALSAQSNLTVAFPRTPPTFPSSADLVEGTGTRAFSALATSAGDWIVVAAGIETNDGSSGLTPTATGLTFTAQNDSGTSPINRSRIFQWTALDASGGSRTITLTPAGGLNYRARATVVRGSDGPGGKATSATAQTISVARQADNSGLFSNVSDWSTGAVGSPTWVPGGSTTASQQGTAGTYIFGRWDDSGLAGTALSGISTPAYTTPAVASLEMLGLLITSTTVNGTAALTAESSLTAVGSNTVLAPSALTIQSNVNSSAYLGQFGTSALSAQSNLNSLAILTRFGVSALSAQSTFTAAGTIARLGSAALASDVTLVAVGTVVGAGVSATLSAQSTFTVAGLVIVLASSGLTANSTMTSAGTITKLGVVALSAQSTMATTALALVTGTVSMSAQSTLTASGTIGALPITAFLSADSSFTVSAVLTRMGNSALSADSTLTANVRLGQFGQSTLSAQSTLTANGTIGKLGTAGLNAQSTLIVSGFIPSILIGTAAFSAIATLQVSGDANPPWILELIEFSTVEILNGKSASSKVSGYEGSSSATVSFEGG